MILVALIGMISLSAFVVTKNGEFVVEQSLSFKDGQNVTIYYVISSSGYDVYSESNLKKIPASRLNNLEDYSFNIVSSYKGNLYYHANTLDEVKSTARELYHKYKNVIAIDKII